jgi:hypothetical protein
MIGIAYDITICEVQTQYYACSIGAPPICIMEVIVDYNASIIGGEAQLSRRIAGL